MPFSSFLLIIFFLPVGSAKKASSTTKAKKIVPRNRRQLVNTSEQSSTVNTTFELSVVSFAGKKSGLLGKSHCLIFENWLDLTA